MTDPLLWLAIVLTVATLYFGAATFSLRDLSRVRLEEVLQQRGREGRLDTILNGAREMILATATLRLIANIGLVLITIQLFHDRIRNPVAHHATVLAIAGGILLVFGLAIPNAWAKYAGEERIAATYHLLVACRILLRPLILVLRLTEEIVRRLVGAPRHDDADEAEQIEQETLEAVGEGRKHGTAGPIGKDTIESVFPLPGTLVGQIMTPRIEVAALDVGASVADARRFITREGHSRIPLYEQDIDHIVGVLYAKDLLRLECDGGKDLRSVVRKVPFVPESESLRDLLREFQDNKVRIAIVTDDYGGTAGLITIEDILDELVGETADEDDLPEPEGMRRLDDTTVEADARIRIVELNGELGTELPESKDGDTIGGFVLAELGRVPTAGEEITAGNVRIRVLDADDRQVRRVQVIVQETPPKNRESPSPKSDPPHNTTS